MGQNKSKKKKSGAKEREEREWWNRTFFLFVCVLPICFLKCLVVSNCVSMNHILWTCLKVSCAPKWSMCIQTTLRIFLAIYNVDNWSHFVSLTGRNHPCFTWWEKKKKNVSEKNNKCWKNITWYMNVIKSLSKLCLRHFDSKQ